MCDVVHPSTSNDDPYDERVSYHSRDGDGSIEEGQEDDYPCRHLVQTCTNKLN